MERISGFLLVIAVLLAGGASRLPAQHPDARARLPRDAAQRRHLDEAVKALQAWYQPATGLYAGTGWWNAANAITVLVDYERITGSRQYDGVLANTFTAAQKTNAGFLNKFYDDEGWWALAWIDAYDLTHERRYRAMAESIFADMAESWDDTCGGGIWWSKDKDYKNAIANELFLSVAAHLANRTAGSERSRYVSWANREWLWFSASGMMNADHLVNDGLTLPAAPRTGACSNNGKTTWTYNQGVVLGGLAELAVAGHAPKLLRVAETIASTAIARLTDADGVLHDPCEPNCGADGPQFKGIFMRNLVRLNAAAPRQSYVDFAKHNADILVNKAQGPDSRYGVQWSGPVRVADAASQTSAIDALCAALMR